MADLRDYQPLMFAVHTALSKQRTSSKYFQIRASGCDRFDLAMCAGKICQMQFSSNLKVFRLAAEKKSSWRVARDIGTDFNFLSQWDKTSEQLLAQASNSGDPRPPFAEMPRVDELPSGLAQYDSEVAKLCSAVIFHRIFQTLSPVLEKGYLVDYRTSWLHGATHWDGAPMTFAWTDANGFCFEPQTRIDEAFCLYHPQAPRIKRHFACTSWRWNEITDLMRFVDALSTAKTAPLFSWNRKNYDRIIFMPSAVSDLLQYILNHIFNAQIEQLCALLPSELVLLDDPSDPLFARNLCLDNRGTPVLSRTIIKDGSIQSWNDAENSRLSGENDKPSIFYPILKSVQAQETAELTAEALSAKREGRTLFIEKIRPFSMDGQLRFFVPEGAALYREGRCLGHVIPTTDSFAFNEFLPKSRPFGCPVRMGNAAVCALEIEI